MKKSLQTFSEVGVTVCVLAAAAAALSLMIGHAVWKEMINQPHQNTQTDEPLKAAVCTETRVLPPDPAAEFPKKFRRELFMKDQRALPKAHFVRLISFAARQQVD